MRRQFSYIRSVPDFQKLANVVWSPPINAYREILADYLDISRRRQDNSYAMARLQYHLLQDLLGHHMQFALLRKQNPTPEEILLQELIIRSLYILGDGIAWRFLAHDRALLYLLGHNPDLPPTQLNPGLVSEFDAWLHANEGGRKFALLNAITRFLRIGDITTLKDDGSIEFSEIKSSESSRGRERRARLHRQKERGNEIVRFLNTGTTVRDSKPTLIIDIPGAPSYRLDVLLRLLEVIKTTGIAHYSDGESIIVEAVRPSADSAQNENVLVDYFQSNLSAVRDTWQKQNDLVATFLTTDRLDFSHNIAPYSVYPLDSQDCADLITGQVMLYIEVNVSHFLRKLTQAGWVVTQTMYEPAAIELREVGYVAEVKSGSSFFRIPKSIIARIAFEFLSVDCLITQLNWLKANTEQRGSKNILPRYVEEHAIWN